MNRFDEVIDRRNTYCTQWDYIKDRFGREDLLPFSISDMDFAVPDKIEETLRERINHPIYGYSRWKHEDYLGAIEEWYFKRFHCTIQKEWICYSPSVMYSIAKLLHLMSEEQDGILIFTPAYDSFYNVIKNNNRHLITSELKKEEKGYVIDFKDFEEKCKSSRVLLLCNPHNPTGRVWTAEELSRIMEICERYSIAVISDDIHMDITYRQTTIPIFNLSNKVQKVICSSPSKTFNTPALQGSYIITDDKELLDRFEHITRYTEFVNSPSIMGVISTITAYRECEDWLEELLVYLRENLKYVKEFVEKNMPLLSFQLPEGCYFAWIDFSKLQVDDKVMQSILMEQGKVAIMSGRMYGASQHLRFHVGCPRSKVVSGLNGLKLAYEAITGGRL